MIRRTFHITDVQWEKLKQLAEETRLGVAEHIRRAIDAYLKAMGK